MADSAYVCMPFAGYKDFADCENQNKDKGDTGAYCGSIQSKVEGDEDISAFLDPAPIASLATILGQNVKDPMIDVIKRKIHHEASGRDWTHMTQEQRRTELIEKAIDIGDQDLYLVAGKDWADLLPATKWKLDNSTENVYDLIEAEIYRKLTI